jgi:hypothetical protein
MDLKTCRRRGLTPRGIKGQTFTRNIESIMDQTMEGSQLSDCDHIPIIDLSDLSSPRIEDRQKLAQSIRDVCTKVGFFYIKVDCCCRISICLELYLSGFSRTMELQRMQLKISTVQQSDFSTFPKSKR